MITIVAIDHLILIYQIKNDYEQHKQYFLNRIS